MCIFFKNIKNKHTVNRGYFAQRGYSAQSVFPLLGLHKLIVSQTWALKPFQYWVHALSYTLLKVFSNFKQCYYNNLPFCIKRTSVGWYFPICGLTKLTIVSEPMVRPQNWKLLWKAEALSYLMVGKWLKKLGKFL